MENIDSTKWTIICIVIILGERDSNTNIGLHHFCLEEEVMVLHNWWDSFKIMTIQCMGNYAGIGRLFRIRWLLAFIKNEVTTLNEIRH